MILALGYFETKSARFLLKGYILRLPPVTNPSNGKSTNAFSVVDCCKRELCLWAATAGYQEGLPIAPLMY